MCTLAPAIKAPTIVNLVPVPTLGEHTPCDICRGAKHGWQSQGKCPVHGVGEPTHVCQQSLLSAKDIFRNFQIESLDFLTPNPSDYPKQNLRPVINCFGKCKHWLAAPVKARWAALRHSSGLGQRRPKATTHRWSGIINSAVGHVVQRTHLSERWHLSPQPEALKGFPEEAPH